MKRGYMVSSLLLALLLVGGCAGSANERQLAQQSVARKESTAAAAASSSVTVPDVIKELDSHEFATSWDQDPDATIKEVEDVVTKVLASAGLKAEIKWQSIVRPDSQEPSAGTVVPRGSVVRVRIGIGD